MDELFRFVALRPPVPSSDEIVVDPGSPLASSLAAARDTTNGRDAMDTLAHNFAQSEDFVADASSLNLPLERFADLLEALGPSEEDWNPAHLVERSLGRSAADVVDSAEFRSDVARLQESLLAMKIVPAERGSAAMLLRLLGAADALRRIASGGENFGGSRRPLVRLPASIFPLPARRVPPAAPLVEQGPSREDIEDDLLTRAGALDDALRELSVVETTSPAANIKATLETRMVYGTPQRERGETPPPVSDRPSVRGSGTVLDAAAVSRLSPAVRETLADLGIDPTLTTLPSVLHALRAELGKTESLLK